MSDEPVDLKAMTGRDLNKREILLDHLHTAYFRVYSALFNLCATLPDADPVSELETKKYEELAKKIHYDLVQTREEMVTRGML